MGSVTWKGQELIQGFTAFIGGKEVELDMPISPSQLPESSVDNELDNITEVASEPVNIHLPESTAKPYKPPIQLYGMGSPKPRIKGPL